MRDGRRRSERAKRQAQDLYARWNRLSPMRRAWTTVLTAAVMTGAVLSACNADRLTGPGPEKRATGEVQREAVTHTEHVAFKTSYSNPCAPEDGPIVFDGYINTLVTVTTDLSGGVHLDTKVQEVGMKGTGLTGKSYNASREAMALDNFNSSGTLVTIIHNDWRIIGPGPRDNFFMYTKVHMNTNASGAPTAGVDDTRTECR